jgi:hypothetical protein
MSKLNRYQLWFAENHMRLVDWIESGVTAYVRYERKKDAKNPPLEWWKLLFTGAAITALVLGTVVVFT